ncbi:MAG: alpha/beta hydrolase [bacterium]|nr:alpha/beta hydrolase [bacterium]
MIHRRIPLWEGLRGYHEGSDGFHPSLETYILNGEQARGLVLICPGGGYHFTSPREAEPVAMQFMAAGRHAAVLWYSVAPRRHPQPLLDLSRAVCLIREHAEDWQVDPQKIAVCGFSAGGHLSASLGVHWNKSYLQDSPGIQTEMNRPNALILAYPVITSGEFRHAGSFQNLLGDNPDQSLLKELSLERQVTTQTPPTFLWHTVADLSVPVENSLLFAQALRKHQVPFELHLYPEGAHGLSLANEETATPELPPDPHVAGWMRLCLEWLARVL